ncbi:DNA polymerase I, partial [Rickettsiales bacterium]|nr:DNA polymerase I [Rickettsiales bacterium]
NNPKKKIALIDSYSFVFRAYFSMPGLTRKDGTPVGAVYGFTKMMLRLLASLDFTHIVAIFDSGSKTFRNEIYNDYKANRPECPEDLKPQFPIIRQVAESLNLATLEKENYEADDLIATIAKEVDPNEYEVLIISPDKDLMQLVSDNVKMYDASKDKMIDCDVVKEKFGVEPEQVLDILALMGDSADNIPGVKGIGPKTASELINQFGSLENLYQNLDQIKQKKRKEYLQNDKDNAYLSKKLARLEDKVEFDGDISNFLVQAIEPKKLISFLEAQNFNSLATKVRTEFDYNNDNISHEISKKSQTNLQKLKIINVKSQNDLELLKNAIKIAKFAIFDAILIEISPNHNIFKDFTISLPQNEDRIEEVFYFSKDILQDNDDLFNQKELSKNDIFLILKDILENKNIAKIGYKIKDIKKFFTQNNINFISDDIALMGYILNSSSGKSEIKNLINEYIDDEEGENLGQFFTDLDKNKKNLALEDDNKRAEIFAARNYFIGNLFSILKLELQEQKLDKIYYNYEIPLIDILIRMELNGVAISAQKLSKLSLQFEGELIILTKEIYQLANEEFNIASPKQLSHILFEKLSLESGKKSKNGAFSTNSDILEELSLQGHVIAEKVLQWRHIAKLKSTYSDALPKSIDQNDGRIHTNYSNITTITGRLSSVNPNLQNIPIRSDDGIKIRNSFIAKKGYKLIMADYSQIELRVLASMANITNLKQAFIDDKDIHAITASEVFNVALNEVTSDLRRKAKAINFGIIYGISSFGLAKQLKISKADAKKYMDQYFKTYPQIKEFMEQVKDIARKDGFVETIIGRKCFLPEINSKNHIRRSFEERLAINAPIQGSAADIIKQAMIDLDHALMQGNYKSKMLLQIHDELIIEAPDDEIEKINNLIVQIMENIKLIDVTLKVDVKINDFWS